jgi:hypothetical protein
MPEGEVRGGRVGSGAVWSDWTGIIVGVSAGMSARCDDGPQGLGAIASPAPCWSLVKPETSLDCNKTPRTLGHTPFCGMTDSHNTAAAGRFPAGMNAA